MAVSPLYSVPKPDSDERRFILDLSWPAGSSVSDSISKDFYLQYCAKEMQTKCVEIRPLFPRIYFEISSNFRERFRWVLPEKLANFVEYSR